MKILRVIDTMDPVSGGPCQGIRNVSSPLVSLGAEAEIVCLDAPDAAYLKTENELTIHAIGPPGGPWRHSEKLLPWLISNLARFDVVIVHGLWLYTGFAVRKAMKTLEKSDKTNTMKLPKVLTMPHGMLDPYFQKDPSRRLKAIRNVIYWKLVEGKNISSSDAMIYTCEVELLLAREAFRPFRPQKELNLGYGIQAPPVLSNSAEKEFLTIYPAAAARPYILFLSRLHQKKGVDIMLEAYLSILEDKSLNESEIPNLIIAGPGLDSDFGKKLLQRTEENPGLKSRVFFTGMLTGTLKWAAIHGCEAFILPSHQENFGISVAEALACSKPVLISKQVNIWLEIIKGGGGLADEDTIEGTRNNLVNWIKLKPSLKKEMALKAFEVYHEHFQAEPVAKRFVAQIGHLIAGL